MQRTGQASSSGSTLQKGARRDGTVAQGARRKAQGLSAPVVSTPRLFAAGAGLAPRRSTANWVAELSTSAQRLLDSVASYRQGGPQANAGPNALMATDGKASSLRKLVVDGVDDSPNVQVRFCLKYRTSYGQSVKIIGSHPSLGNWDINKALVLSWTDGDRWVATIELPAGSVYEYKYVLVDHDGRSALAWQGGSNSVLAIGDQDEQGVEVQDNWHNNPGQAAVVAGGQTLTRETKLQAWAEEMKQYRALARSAQFELSRKAEELQASKAQVARLKMELSMSLKAREELESRLADLEGENLSLRAQVAQSQIAMKSTLEEAIKLLQQEIEEGEEELYSTGLGDEHEQSEATSSSNGSAGASSPSSNGSGWGWGRSKEAETVYAGSNGSGSSNGSGGSNGATFERFGFRLSGNTFDQPQHGSDFGQNSGSRSNNNVLADWRTRLGSQ
ncbi:hypothetical protein HXX76_009430 [Chlamydomonas incerta]|uniref:CBM20 domain-containing protein n=1 Tax=Chlamydomonas incerta TaxID=51695 RepID=A0A835T2R9_CHLIN|nr:hypothetical protein HXX76_009430 [Chlamydomonas incerta]|eukprot:KAG2431415.1 hypothetical protein HXX76_009430 [Chlamydomonas incerta]